MQIILSYFYPPPQTRLMRWQKKNLPRLKFANLLTLRAKRGRKYNVADIFCKQFIMRTFVCRYINRNCSGLSDKAWMFLSYVGKPREVAITVYVGSRLQLRLTG